MNIEAFAKERIANMSYDDMERIKAIGGMVLYVQNPLKHTHDFVLVFVWSDVLKSVIYLGYTEERYNVKCSMRRD